jgi:hypothetical protein
MPEAPFGQRLNLPIAEGRFIKLEHKGDKIRFRLANTPHYQTKHFLDDKTTVFCGKYNSEDKKATCRYCDQYQKIFDEKGKKAAEYLKPVVTFYYPIVNMDTNEAQIFEFRARSIHYTIAGYADDGIDVFAYTWSVNRIEEPGNYYEIKRLGDKVLSEAQLSSLKVAKTFRLASKKSSSLVINGPEDPKDK